MKMQSDNKDHSLDAGGVESHADALEAVSRFPNPQLSDDGALNAKTDDAGPGLDDELALDDLDADAEGEDLDTDIMDDATIEFLPLEEEIVDEGEKVVGDDDDNPYEESDEALEDDVDGRPLDRIMPREAGRFGE
jgi:hypothetical protein